MLTPGYWFLQLSSLSQIVEEIPALRIFHRDAKIVGSCKDLLQGQATGIEVGAHELGGFCGKVFACKGISP